MLIRSVQRHIEDQWRFVHISSNMWWVVVFFAKFYNITAKLTNVIYQTGIVNSVEFFCGHFDVSVNHSKVKAMSFSCSFKQVG